MAGADFVHNTHIAACSFTYNADSSSAIFRFMSTFVRLIEALDGFLPTLRGGILTRLSGFDESRDWRSTMLEQGVNEIERARSSTQPSN